MRAFCVAVVLGLTVASCGIARQARIQELQAQSLAASQRCDVSVPAGNAKTAVERAKCQTQAWAILRPIMPYPDLLDLMIASRLTIAEQIQNGKLTIAQGNEQIAAKRSELAAEEQRRNLANRSVAAQEGMAAASQSAAGPHSCTWFGNTVNCF